MASVPFHVVCRRAGMTRDLGVALFTEIARALLSGQSVRVPGFGTFSLKERKGRTFMGRSFGEQKLMTIKRSFRLKFKPAEGIQATIDKIMLAEPAASPEEEDVRRNRLTLDIDEVKPEDATEL